MIYRKKLRVIILVISLCVFSIAPIAAVDVVFLQNGDIILGTLSGPVPGGVTYTAFGGEITVPLDSITATGKSLSDIAKKKVKVVLKDGSTIQGEIVDFDTDIGVFIDISFGTLTIPCAAISEIYQADRRTRYTGAAMQISTYGGLYKPFGDSSKYFGSGWYAGAGVDWFIPPCRGFYVGVRSTLYGIHYTPDTSVKYFMISLRPEITYKYMGWRMHNSFLASLVPYASFGAGPAYIEIKDPASYPANYGSIAGEIVLSTGVEFSVLRNLIIKLEGNGSVVLQKGTPFYTAGAMLSLCYER
jgi:small nuclear ribonucleoprotein (snRNP)-like protein